MLEKGLAWWKQRLGNEWPAVELPTDRPRSLRRSVHGARQTVELAASLTDSLRDLSRRNNATLFMTLTAAFKTLLLRHSGQEDIVIGVPVATRTRAETRGLIGFFVNTVALRTDLSGNPTFIELVARVREAALGAYAHSRRRSILSRNTSAWRGHRTATSFSSSRRDGAKSPKAGMARLGPDAHTY